MSAKMKANGASKKPAAESTSADAVPNSLSTTVTVDRETLLAAIVPDPDWDGDPALTALTYAADELEALSEAEGNGFDTTNVLYRLRLRMRAAVEILRLLSLDDEALARAQAVKDLEKARRAAAEQAAE